MIVTFAVTVAVVFAVVVCIVEFKGVNPLTRTLNPFEYKKKLGYPESSDFVVSEGKSQYRNVTCTYMS